MTLSVEQGTGVLTDTQPVGIPKIHLGIDITAQSRHWQVGEVRGSHGDMRGPGSVTESMLEVTSARAHEHRRPGAVAIADHAPPMSAALGQSGGDLRRTQCRDIAHDDCDRLFAIEGVQSDIQGMAEIGLRLGQRLKSRIEGHVRGVSHHDDMGNERTGQHGVEGIASEGPRQLHALGCRDGAEAGFRDGDGLDGHDDGPATGGWFTSCLHSLIQACWPTSSA